MPNQVFGPYAKTAWSDGVTMGNQTRMNNLESQASVALHSLNPDLCGPFVLSGCAASGTVGTTTVNISSGTAYIKVSDGTTGKIAVSSATQTTSAFSSTYNLYLQPDGTFYWSTSNSPATNSLYLATVATNGSGQISAITDKRVMSPSMLFAAADVATVPVVVAKCVATHITGTGALNVLDYVVPATGVYRVSAYVYMNNSANEQVLFSVTWYDPSTGGGISRNFFDYTNFWDGLTTITKNHAYPFAPEIIYAQTGHNITIGYYDSAGTPSDFVTVVIERIA